MFSCLQTKFFKNLEVHKTFLKMLRSQSFKNFFQICISWVVGFIYLKEENKVKTVSHLLANRQTSFMTYL